MRVFFAWFLALVITLSAVIYQRKTGPTYPRQFTVEVNGNSYELKLVRSLSLDELPLVKLAIADTSLKAKLFFRKYPSNDEFQSAGFQFRSIPVHSFVMNKIFKVYTEKGFFAEVPKQPAAGKIEYYFDLTDIAGTKTYLKNLPVIIRFKGGVPAGILAPHILFMFIAMLFSTLSGLLAAFRVPSFREFGVWTFGTLLIGGMILGPLVQLYAFGDLWTGVPYGWDLTDNKTLIAFAFWLLAVLMNRKKAKPSYAIIAALVLLLVYSIPHSMFGSQLDYQTGTVTQGIILNFFFL